MPKRTDSVKSKESKKSVRSAATVKSNTTGAPYVDHAKPACLNISLFLEGSPGLGQWHMLIIFNGKIIKDIKWEDQLVISEIELFLDLKDLTNQSLLADQPLLSLLRTMSCKTSRTSDPLLSHENKAGCSVDLLPIILGENKIKARMPFISLDTGKHLNHCFLNICVTYSEKNIPNIETIPLSITLISAHCLPATKDVQKYAGSIELANVHSRVSFGISLSDSTTEHIVWASSVTGGKAAYTHYTIPDEDKYISMDFNPKSTEICVSVYWNAMRRILVNPDSLRDRLKSRFFVEIGAAQKSSDIHLKHRYMASVDAGVLLEANQSGVTACAKMFYVDDAKSMLKSPTSITRSHSEYTAGVVDEYGHSAYIIIRFDLYHCLTPKIRTSSYYENLGIIPPDGLLSSIFEFDQLQTPSDDKHVDARSIRKEGGALALHQELSKLIPDKKQLCNKHSASNNLSKRLKLVLKNFEIENSDNWQNVVTSQHQTCRSSVQASFAPYLNAKQLKFSHTFAAARARIAGNTITSERCIESDLKRFPKHPKPLYALALRRLENRSNKDALNYLWLSLKSQPRNKYVLWTLGGIEFDKSDAREIAKAALNIAVNGDVFDGITGTIGWAALHTFYHFRGDSYAAFVAAKKMRKWFELEQPWRQFIDRWMNISGEKEIYWDPKALKYCDPLLFASAFFLCLRCYEFSEKLLCCFENGCTTRGSRFSVAHVLTADVYYIRVASLILQEQLRGALTLIHKSVKIFGPSAIMSEMRAVSTVLLGEWNKDCENAITEAENLGAKLNPFVLYNAGLAKINTDSETALQYAARAYRLDSSAFTALLIARIYDKMDDHGLAQRWAAVAVNEEPLLSDGWAFLATLAFREQDITKAVSMLRTSDQVGQVCPDIERDLKKALKTIALDGFPHLVTKNICFCEYS